MEAQGARLGQYSSRLQLLPTDDRFEPMLTKLVELDYKVTAYSCLGFIQAPTYPGSFVGQASLLVCHPNIYSLASLFANYRAASLLPVIMPFPLHGMALPRSCDWHRLQGCACSYHDTPTPALKKDIQLCVLAAF